MFRLFRFAVLIKIKLLSMLFYRFELRWLSSVSKDDWQETRLIIFLNHTSLFEPLFVALAPTSFIWRLSKELIVPGADITMNRPLTGRFFKAAVPGLIPISRKNDHTWQAFLNEVTNGKVTGILPEGRMKRRNGLDKHGKPMTVRGGVVDILSKLNSGKILFVYSGGLHHVQAPGGKLPRIFNQIKANMEFVDIVKYKQKLASDCEKSFKQNVMNDLNCKLVEQVPK